MKKKENHSIFEERKCCENTSTKYENERRKE